MTDINHFKKELIPLIDSFNLEFRVHPEGDLGDLEQVVFESQNFGGNFDFWDSGSHRHLQQSYRRNASHHASRHIQHQSIPIINSSHDPPCPTHRQMTESIPLQITQNFSVSVQHALSLHHANSHNDKSRPRQTADEPMRKEPHTLPVRRRF